MFFYPIFEGIFFIGWGIHSSAIGYSTFANKKIEFPELAYFLQIVCRVSYVLTPLLAMVYDRRFKLRLSRKKRTPGKSFNPRVSDGAHKFYLNVNNN